jgi:hypothetical protein
MNIVARDVFVAHQPGGASLKVVLEVGAPFEDQPHEWVSTLSLKPLHKTEMKIRGESSLQAICLALALAKTLLDDVTEKGGRIAHEDGQSVDLNATFGVKAK